MSIEARLKTIDAVAAALSKWIGTPYRGVDRMEREDEFRLYAMAGIIVQDDEGQIDRPDEWARDMAKAANRAAEIRAILRSLDHQQARFFSLSMQLSGLLPEPLEKAYPEDSDEASRWGVDQAIAFFDTIEAAARKNEDVAQRWAIEHPPGKRNADWRNRDVALAVALFYTQHTRKDPPKAGLTGPFQELLKKVYAALGRHGVDLRGPLAWVHQAPNAGWREFSKGGSRASMNTAIRPKS